MFALFKKEIRYFFTSPIGLTIIGLFVVLNGLFLWVFKTDYNIFNAGFADLLPFFRLSSWIFVFLVPALTMRSISEEKKGGMLTLLFTKPISLSQIVVGKYYSITISYIYIYCMGIRKPHRQFRYCRYYRFLYCTLFAYSYLCCCGIMGFFSK